VALLKFSGIYTITGSRAGSDFVIPNPTNWWGYPEQRQNQLRSRYRLSRL